MNTTDKGAGNAGGPVDTVVKRPKRTKQRLRDAREAVRLYERGYTTAEIMEQMGVTEITVWRYYGLMGGLSERSQALHQYNRHVLKLPEKDKGQGTVGDSETSATTS